MLPFLTTAPAEFASIAAATEHLDARIFRRAVVPLRDLRLDRRGRLTHAGASPIAEIDHLPVTDAALAHLHRMAGVPGAFAARLDPDLHELTLAELLAGHLGTVSVLVEHGRGDADSARVVAVVPGARATLPHETVLSRVVALGLDASVRFDGGAMDVRLSCSEAVEALTRDVFDVRAVVRNDRWGDDRGRPALDVALFVLRLVCTNGCLARRELAAASAHAWSSRHELDGFVDRQLARVLEHPVAPAFRAAAARMSEELATDDRRREARRMIARGTTEDDADALLEGVVSTYDVWNALTAAASHRARSDAARRRLQVAGGALFDRYLEAS